MSDAKGRSYSAVEGKRNLLRLLTGARIAGTNASDAVLVGSQIKVPAGWNGVLKSAAMYLITGATGAGTRSIRLERSLAGTGTYSTLCTFTFSGTSASDLAVLGTGVATTQILGGDMLRLTAGSGTIAVDAATLFASFDAEFEESFVGA